MVQKPLLGEEEARFYTWQQTETRLVYNLVHQLTLAGDVFCWGTLEVELGPHYSEKVDSPQWLSC